MSEATKEDRLRIEAAARNAVGRMYSCSPVRRKIPVSENGPLHEFDIYAEKVVIGGVSTSPLNTSGANRNTGGCDRAERELFWLSLWQGPETRIHVLTDRPLAEWLVNRAFKGAVFPFSITIYHYDCLADALHEIGILARQNGVSSTQL